MALKAYYNEIDPFAAQWLRNLISEGLITPGDVDERDIREVKPDDLKGYDRCHFFAGIGGWDYALNLAGWEGPVWTGSCPCQRFSSATRGRRTADDLWPEWKRLIVSARPRVVFGEQVASTKSWVDNVCGSMENMGYAFGAAVLPAYSVGQDHARERIYFVGHTNEDCESIRALDEETPRMPGNRSKPSSVARANGVSRSVARELAGFGNAIVPQVASEFIRAFMDV